MKKKIKKGEYGYINSMRKRTLVKTLILFFVALMIFVCGMTVTGKKENIVTVIAVLAILPACRSLVNFIMFMRFHSKDKELVKALKDIFSKDKNMEELFRVLTFSDSIITMEKGGSYQISAFACLRKSLVGYAELEPAKIHLVEEHLKRMLKNNGLSKITVKIFDNKEHFLERSKELVNLYQPPRADEIDAIFEETDMVDTQLKDIKADFETIALIGALSL